MVHRFGGSMGLRMKPVSQDELRSRAANPDSIRRLEGYGGGVRDGEKAIKMFLSEPLVI